MPIIRCEKFIVGTWITVVLPLYGIFTVVYNRIVILSDIGSIIIQDNNSSVSGRQMGTERVPDKLFKFPFAGNSFHHPHFPASEKQGNNQNSYYA